MADEVSVVSYYMGSIPNKLGEGAKVLNALRDAGVNLIGFLGYPRAARKAEIVVVLDEKGPNLGPIAKKAGFELGKKQRGLFVKGEDRPGALAEKVGALAAAGVNVVSLHGICAGADSYGALVVVDSADFRKASKALGL